MSDRYDLVCIGSGPAGQKAAVQAAKLGKRVAVVERGPCVGGGCVVDGTIPSKTFREAVRAAVRYRQSDLSRRAGHTAVTARDLLGRVDAVRDQETHIIHDQLTRNGVAVFQGDAHFVDPHRVAVDADGGTRVLEAKFVLVATGTTAARPEHVACDGAPVIVSDGVISLERIPKTLAVIGGGVIGLEYASMFAALGSRVTVVDKRPRVLEFLDHEIVDELVHQMRGQGVTFRLGEAVADLAVVTRETGEPCGLLTLESGKRVVADVVLFSIGRVGATATLALEAAGLAADARGRLEVNDAFQTRVPHVYAAGDVIGFPSLAATSAEQGRRAALHMFGEEASKMADHFPLGIYSIPEISCVGATEEELTKARVPYEVGVSRFRETARGQILDDHDGLLKLVFHRETRALLGVHIIGAHATELVHTGQAVLALGGGLDYFMDTVFNYPTLAECYKVAAMDAYNKLELARRYEARAA